MRLATIAPRFAHRRGVSSFETARGMTEPPVCECTEGGGREGEENVHARPRVRV